MTRKVKNVSFNLNDPVEKEMLEYMSKYPFSTHVKRLIQLEIRGGINTHKPVKQLQSSQPIKSESINKNLMRNFI